MIVTAIFNLVFVFISFILTPLSLLGDVVLDPNFTSSITTASGYFHSLNVILPVDTMIQIFGVSLAFEGIYLLYKMIMWVIGKIPIPTS